MTESSKNEHVGSLYTAILSDLEELNAYCTDDAGDREVLAGELASRMESLLVRPNVDGLFSRLNGNKTEPDITLSHSGSQKERPVHVAYTIISDEIVLEQRCEPCKGESVAFFNSQCVSMTRRELIDMVNHSYKGFSCRTCLDGVNLSQEGTIA